VVPPVFAALPLCGFAVLGERRAFVDTRVATTRAIHAEAPR